MPSRIPAPGILGFALLLLMLQFASGTDHLFAYLIFVVVLLSGWVFNLLGGLTTVSGVAVTAMVLKFVILSQIAKLIVWQPADHNLEVPQITAGVFAVGLLGICLAAWLAAKAGIRRYLFHHPMEMPWLRSMAIVVFGVGLLATVGSIALGGGEEGGLRVGGIAGVLRQFSFCLGFSVVVTTACVVLESQGQRCLGWFNGLPLLFSFLSGLLYASKQGMFEPFLYLLMTLWAFGFRLRPRHLVAGGCISLIAVMLLYPFAQQARNEVRGLGFKQTVMEMTSLLRRDFGSWEGYAELRDREEASGDDFKDYRYFDVSSSFLERLSLIKMVDLLVSATLRNGPGGSETVTHGFKMLLPRFLYPQKPVWNTGQILGHRAGMLADDDESTQISFGFIADAFGAYGWAGAFWIPFCIALAFFLMFRALLGPVAGNVWSVFFATQFQHSFTEATIASMVLEILYRPMIYLVIHLGLLGLLKVWELSRQDRHFRREQGRESWS